jgi:hypothetical protein
MAHRRDNFPTLPRKILCFLAELAKQSVHIVATLLCIDVTGFPNFLQYYSFFHISIDINSVGVEITGHW